MTALVSGDADIGFMGSEASIYTYANGSQDYAVNFAQLTQRAGNFLVGREPDPSFSWEKLKGKEVLGGRAGGMPEMVFEYILKKTALTPRPTSPLTKAFPSASQRLHLQAAQPITRWNLSLLPLVWKPQKTAMWSLL